MISYPGRRERAWFYSALGIWLAVLVSFSGAQSPTAPDDSLFHLAHSAYVASRYPDAVMLNRRIADEFPQSARRAYALQMLGTIHEENLLDFDRAIHWYRAFLSEFPGARRARSVQARVRFLEGLGDQKEAFRQYQKAVNPATSARSRIEGLEKLLESTAGFVKEEEAYGYLAVAYLQEGEYRKHYGAVKMRTSLDRTMSGEQRAEKVAYARSIWKRSFVAKCCWAYLLVLLLWTLAGKPWHHPPDRRTWRIWAIGFAISLIASATGFVVYLTSLRGLHHDPFQPASMAIWHLFGPVNIAWVWAFSKTRIGQWEAAKVKWAIPLLVVSNACAACILFFYYQPNWIHLSDEFLERYGHWGIPFLGG